MLKNISLHPKLAAIADMTLGMVMLWWLRQIGVWWLIIIWFGFRQFLWAGFIQLMYCPVASVRWRHFLSLTFFNLGVLFLLLFVEWAPAWNLVAVIHIAFVFVSFWILPSGKAVGTALSLKQHLRWRFILCTVGMAGIYSGLNSIILFRIFYTVNNWVWIIGVVILATFLAAWHWNEYGIRYNGIFLRWLAVFFLLSIQFVWVMMQLPLGYMANGILLIWHWYILWLIGRFSMSAEGVIWKKQTFFLMTNAILCAVFLFFIVRWK